VIESIHIAKTATYGDVQQSLSGLKTFNYIYGSNGSGKTTISRVIANPAAPSHAHCRLDWKGGTPIEALVYNRDFVEENFGQAEIKGVFTLGKQTIEAAEALSLASAEVVKQTASIASLTAMLRGVDGTGGKKGELEKLEAWLTEKCWDQKIKHDAKLMAAFEGNRGEKSKFKRKVLSEAQANKATAVPLVEIEARALTVYGAAPVPEGVLAAPSPDQLLSREVHPVLAKVVVGSKDVDIAAMIEKLGNSDWVKQGRPYFLKNGGDCPFCQQRAPATLEASLVEYFSGAFATDVEAIEALARGHAVDAKAFLDGVNTVIATGSGRLDLKALVAQRDIASAKIEANQLLIDAKLKEPSRVVALESLAAPAAAIAALIAAANAAIRTHNAMVLNLKTEKDKLTAQVWRHLLDIELKADLARYVSEKAGLDKAIANLAEQIEAVGKAKLEKQAEIRALEKVATSVQPTVNEINSLLASYGFRSFSLARVGETSSYALRRADGAEARQTLSEGEKSFVTFLYFYFLLKGSASDSGTVSPRVAVFDDPVSSLDSDVLFIVSSLIHGLMEEIRAKTCAVKQLIILTHNVHFHREVTFNTKREKNRVLTSEESFWLVRKPDDRSRLESCTEDPVSSSYEMLWAEVRRPDRSPASIQNTLRRILESYFKILGGIDPKSLRKHFSGNELAIFKSMFSWVDAGSHALHDDLYFAIDASSIENHVRVFQAIFEHSGHGAHYRMMMREAEPEVPPAEIA
jgi:wobble nucleotide-excising tRNase